MNWPLIALLGALFLLVGWLLERRAAPLPPPPDTELRPKTRTNPSVEGASVPLLTFRVENDPDQSLAGGHHVVVAFVSYGRSVLGSHPELVHHWDVSGSSVKLDFPKQSEDGYDVFLRVDHDSIYVGTSTGAHWILDSVDDPSAVAEEIFGLIGGLLSPDVRIRERLANDEPYRSDVQVFDGKRWRTTQVVRLLTWKVFARRSERIYRNWQLPGRFANPRHGA